MLCLINISTFLLKVLREMQGNHMTHSTTFLVLSKKTPGNWLLSLRNSRFKTQFIAFLIDYWADDQFADTIKDKIIFANSGDICYSYRNIDGRIIRIRENTLCCTHEEADSRMVFHLSTITQRSKVIIRSMDTDVLIILLGCKANLSPLLQIWMEVGLSSKNNLRYIQINAVYEHFGENMCKAMPALHAFTGSDYTAAFCRKGKIRPLRILLKNEDVINTFARFGELSTDT